MDEKSKLQVKPQGTGWKEYNRQRKEDRKKRKEEKLVKKAKIDDEKQEKAAIAVEAQIAIKNAREEISTLSIAVPGSILENAQSAELRTYLAGQIARAACIYKADEVIVFDDVGDVTEGDKKKIRKDDVLGVGRSSCIQLARILQYLECPQYLRKFFFPLHQDLQYAGLLNPLDSPHHLRQHDVSLFREGIVTNKLLKSGHGSQVNVGLLNNVHVDKVLAPGLRVTVNIPAGQENTKKIKGFVVSPSTPKLESGVYWGYSVTLASSLSDIFSKCPYKGGYDLTIGTSDKGSPVDNIDERSLKYHHALIVFGGLTGLETALEADPNLEVDDPSLIFHQYLNTCPMQGSRTIRTEEAILVSLAELRSKLSPKFSTFTNNQFLDYKNPELQKNGSDLTHSCDES